MLPLSIRKRKSSVDGDKAHDVDLEPKVLKRVKESPSSLKELVRGIPNSEPTTLTGTFTAILSGLICGILAVTFNVVKALLTFDAILQIAPIGIGCYHVTTIVAGLGAAFFSACPISMGGPNIKHALLLSPMVIQPMICKIDPAVDLVDWGQAHKLSARFSPKHLPARLAWIGKSYILLLGYLS